MSKIKTISENIWTPVYFDTVYYNYKIAGKLKCNDSIPFNGTLGNILITF